MHTPSSLSNDAPAPSTSVLGTLRALLPNRRLLLGEALHLAELQAQRLRTLRGHTDVPVPTEIIAGLPRLVIENDYDLPTRAASGVNYWDDQRRSWIIGLNPTEPRTRRRFSALHEFKHILDYYHPGIDVSGQEILAHDPDEIVADYFAGCVLIPRQLLKSAYYGGVQRVDDLAELFDVSRQAIQVRLSQIGLTPAVDARAPRYRLQQPRRSRQFAGAAS